MEANLVDIHIISQMLCWVTYIEPKIFFQCMLQCYVIKKAFCSL